MSRDGRPPLRALPSAGGRVVPLPARDVDARREADLAAYARSIGVDPADGRGLYDAARERLRAVAAGVQAARRSTLGAAVAAVLAGLGGTGHEVARTLGNAGARGWPGDPEMDPLCRWLAVHMPDVGVWLGDGYLRVWHLDARVRDVADVPLPGPVAKYAAAAAAGAYAWLRLSYTPPTVPVPHVDLGGGAEPPWWPDDDDVAVAAAADPTPGDAGERPPAVVAPSPEGVTAEGEAPPTRQVPAGGGDAGRDLAHEPYVDAVVYALQLRGVEPSGYWPGPSGTNLEEHPQRQATVILPPEAWEELLPDYSQVLLLWSEQRGWRLVPMRGWDVDTDAVLAWWDSLDGHRPVLPEPERLAAWVAAVLRFGLTVGPHVGVGVSAGAPPSWRLPGTHDPAFEAALDAYQGHIGHTLAGQDRAATTLTIPAVDRAGPVNPDNSAANDPQPRPADPPAAAWWDAGIGRAVEVADTVTLSPAAVALTAAERAQARRAVDEEATPT